MSPESFKWHCRPTALMCVPWWSHQEPLREHSTKRCGMVNQTLQSSFCVHKEGGITARGGQEPTFPRRQSP